MSAQKQVKEQKKNIFPGSNINWIFCTRLIYFCLQFPLIHLFNFLLTVISFTLFSACGRESRDRKLKSSHKKSKYLSPDKKLKDSPAKIHKEDKLSPERAADHFVSESRGLEDNIELTKKGQEINR